MQSVEQVLLVASHGIGVLIGIVGVTIIFYGCMWGLVLFLLRFMRRNILLADIRIEIGHYLALGLEFFIAKDMIDIILRPTWDELGKLAVIIALRSALTLFLAHEVKEVREEIEQEGVIRNLKAKFSMKK